MISILRKIKGALEYFAPEETVTLYQNFTVHHHRNDSLIKRIKSLKEGFYEREETTILVDILKKSEEPVMMDIGANIGLMSINVCSELRNVHIYAFEPGPNQFSYLDRNIRANNLQKNVSTFNLALGKHTGSVDFFIHDVKDSSGDGMRDTGRAGKTEIVSVKADTLDNWWARQGRPYIPLVKLDTEGSELEILKHAQQFIEACKPIILIEICYLNFVQYNLSFEDHIDFFDRLNYDVRDISTNKKIDRHSPVWKDQFYYLAIPQEYDPVH